MPSARPTNGQLQVSPNGQPPKLADGVELAGRYEDSGYEEPPFIVRRADGQVVQLPGPLYALAEEVDGQRTYEELAERLSKRIGRDVGPGDVQTLVEERLRPLGVLAQADGSSPELPKLDPLLALRFRVALFPESAASAVARLFTPLFFPPVVLLVVGAFLAADVWVFGIHGVAQGMSSLLYEPLWMLGVLGIILVNTAWHELGHASALKYGGGRPGALGAGIYIVWPAFYTDVTDAYRLGRGGRIRTDLGGVYFNAIFVLGVAGAYAFTGFEPLLIVIVLIHLQMLQQFLPFLRLDGYYLVSDLTGVPDLFARIKPTLKSALPGSGDDEKAEELKPWVRRVTTLWVALVIPVIVLVFGFIVFNAPRMAATGWDSFWLQADRAESRFGEGAELSGGVAVLQAGLLLLPAAGMAYTFSRVGVRFSSGAWSWSEGSPVRRGAVACLVGVLIAVGGYVLAPNGDYTPIQPGERGTLLGGLREFTSVHTGRPSFTEERERDFDEIVYRRDVERTDSDRTNGSSSDDTDTTVTTETDPAATTSDGTTTASTTDGATTPATDTTGTVPPSTTSESTTTETTTETATTTTEGTTTDPGTDTMPTETTTTEPTP